MNSKIYLDDYCVLAAECNICIVPGTFTELDSVTTEDSDALFSNVTYFIDNNGSILGRYVKKNIWHPERPHIKGSGESPHLAFDTPFGKVGLLICWDLAFSEAFRELILQGAKIIIIPSFWMRSDAGLEGLKRNPLSERTFLDAAIVTRAFENTCAIVFCNTGGPPEEDYAGGSHVALPFIGTIQKIDSNEEQMALADIDMDILDEAESVYKIRQDLSREDWHYVYRNLA